MDDELVAAVENQEDEFQQGSLGVKSEDELACRAAVVQVAFMSPVRGGMQGVVVAYSVLPC